MMAQVSRDWSVFKYSPPGAAEPKTRLSPFAEHLPQRIHELIQPRCEVNGYIDTHVGVVRVNTESLKDGEPPVMRRVLMISCDDGGKQLLILKD